jgi:hypothetical protein
MPVIIYRIQPGRVFVKRSSADLNPTEADTQRREEEHNIDFDCRAWRDSHDLLPTPPTAGAVSSRRCLTAVGRLCGIATVVVLHVGLGTKKAPA